MSILIVYTTKNGRTGEMIEPICDGIRSEALEVVTRSVENVTWEEMLMAQGLIIGNQTRFGGMDWQLKRLFDVTAVQGFPGPLAGKIGGAFGAGSRAGSGAELSLLATLHVLLNHGLIIQGNAHGAHYGPVYLSDTSEKEMRSQCHDWGRLWARLAKRINSNGEA